MKVITGDLIELAKQGEFNIIIHGCNCFCTMGNGIAKQIKAEFPEAYITDRKTKKGDIEKLGSYSASYSRDFDITVINAYTQYKFYGSSLLVDYDAIRKIFNRIAIDFSSPEVKIGYPKIGAGLAGGDWDIISKIIDEELEGLDHTLVVLPE